MASGDIEVLGFTHHLSDRRFRVQPPISLGEYIEFTKRSYERRVHENPDGDWSSPRYIAGGESVNIFGNLSRDSSVPRPVLEDLKAWLERLYKKAIKRSERVLFKHTVLPQLEPEKAFCL
jgi:hypothetical protein